VVIPRPIPGLLIDEIDALRRLVVLNHVFLTSVSEQAGVGVDISKRDGMVPMAGFENARFGITPPGNTQSFVDAQVGEL